MALIEKRCRAQEFGSWSSITSLCTPFIILFHLFHFHLICMGLILSPCKPIEIVLAKLCFILIRLLWLRCIWSYSFFFVLFLFNFYDFHFSLLFSVSIIKMPKKNARKDSFFRVRTRKRPKTIKPSLPSKLHLCIDAVWCACKRMTF